MKFSCLIALFFLSACIPASATVVVSSPANGSSVSSPVSYVASATSATCSKGVSAMGIYVNNTLAYTVNGASLRTGLALNPGTYNTVVQEWDNCGTSTSASIRVTVPGAAPVTGTQNGVIVTSPAANSTVSSPVKYTATAGSTTCSSGISAMGIYVNNSLAYSVTGASLSTPLTLGAGAQHTVVQEWDNCGGSLATTVNVTVQASIPPTISLTATPSTITGGSTSTLNVGVTNGTQVVVSGTDGSKYPLSATGGSQIVTPGATTTYTVEATGTYGHSTSSATVTVVPQGNLQAVSHVLFMLQENHTFDNYFGMLNPYRRTNGWNVGDDGNTYNVDGIDDKLSTISNQNDAGTSFPLFKLASTCVDDESSAWLESYGDVSRYDFSPTRSIAMDGFVHTASGFATSCASSGVCSGTFTDMAGKRAMGYYDQGFLNYYYYMASQFALSDRWFSPVSSKSIDNRIATFTGGTTQGLVFDPGSQDHLPQLAIPTIFQELDQASVTWKIYYSTTQGGCAVGNPCSASPYPGTDFDALAYSYKYVYQNTGGAACTGTTQPSSVVGDATNSFCVDPNHIAPITQYYTDLNKSTLPSFAFIESGSGINDEHPGSGQSILMGQAQVAKVVNALMASPAWKSSVFFLSYDEGGGSYEHVPPVPGHSNANTSASLGSIPDISQIAVNADSYVPCVPGGGIPTLHCDLNANSPGASAGDAAAKQGFSAQLGFRVPNLVISPFSRKHYVSHIPMDHTAVIKFIENRFIGPSAHLTARDAAQPNLLDLFDFTNSPWAAPPTPPAPVTIQSLGYDSCTPTNMGP